MQSSRALREGRLGLFALGGLLVFGALAIWVRGGGFGQRTYQLIFEFADVEGLQVGAPVRFRGVRVGRINTRLATDHDADRCPKKVINKKVIDAK